MVPLLLCGLGSVWLVSKGGAEGREDGVHWYLVSPGEHSTRHEGDGCETGGKGNGIRSGDITDQHDVELIAMTVFLN
jgi:hypothetical protein